MVKFRNFQLQSKSSPKLRVRPLWTCKGWNLAQSRNFQSCWKFGSKMRVLPTLNQQRIKFDKIQKNFDLCWKFGSKIRFLTTPDLRRMRYGKIQIFSVALKIWLAIEILITPDLWRMKFYSCQKFNSKLTFLTTRDMQRIKCGKIQKFSSAIKIKPKIESFDHSGHAKDEIWQNPEIFSHAANLAKKWECWPLWTSKGWNLTKSRKNLICVKNLAQKIDFWPLQTCKGWNLAKSRYISVALRIWLEIKSLTTPDLRRMIFCKVNILIHVKNLAQNWHFWPLATCEGWNLAKSRNFQLRQTFGETFEHSGPAKDKIWQHLEILNCFKNLARKWDFWSLWTWPIMKFRNLTKSWNFQSQLKFGSKLTFLTTPDLERLKFGKIKKLWAVLKIWLKIDIFDHSACKWWNALTKKMWQGWLATSLSPIDPIFWFAVTKWPPFWIHNQFSTISDSAPKTGFLIKSSKVC